MSTPAPKPAIQIDALTKRYGSLTALDGVSLTVPEGSFFALLGPNGAGKSTLINTLAGLTLPTSGSAAICGHDVHRDYQRARQAIGIVPQELVFDPFFTVSEVLDNQAGYFGVRGQASKAWQHELLEELELSNKADATLRQLSGGMKRRLLIAQALVHKPRVLVLDEPTAGVDVELRQTLWRFAKRLHNEGHTIVLTTHYLEEAEALCDEIAVLNKGALVAQQAKSELMGRYPYRLLTLQLEAAVELPAALAAAVEHVDGCQVTLKLHRDRDRLMDVLAQVSSVATIVDVSVQEPSLEDAFLYLTGGAA